VKRSQILISLAALLWAAAAIGQTVVTGEKPHYENEFLSPMAWRQVRCSRPAEMQSDGGRAWLGASRRHL
jgi:hypothetical protein